MTPITPMMICWVRMLRCWLLLSVFFAITYSLLGDSIDCANYKTMFDQNREEMINPICGC